MENKVYRTRTFRLLPDTTDGVEKRACWDKLYNWQFLSFRAANLILTHLFIQVGIKQLFYIEEGVNVKLASAAKDADGIFTTSKENTTCQLLSRAFKGQIPVTILTWLNHHLTREFNRNREAYLRGETRIAQPKRNGPIGFNAADIRRVKRADDGRNYTFTLYGIPFITFLGRDFTDRKTLLDAWAAGTLKWRDCSLLLKENKIFLRAGFDQLAAEGAGGGALAEVSLSLECPLHITIGRFSCTIGSKEEFLYRRLAIRAARLRVEASIGTARSGKGKKRKTKAVQNHNTIERNFINYQLHVYSRRLVDLCRSRQVGTILLVDQRQKEAEAKEDPFLLQNWSYYNLKQKIEYKAALAGITVIVE